MSERTNTSTPRTDAVIESPYNYPGHTEKNAVVILCRRLEQELAAVTADRDLLLKDHKRLDWLDRGCIHVTPEDVDDDSYAWLLMQYRIGKGMVQLNDNETTDLRAAIDAAMQEEGEQ